MITNDEILELAKIKCTVTKEHEFMWTDGFVTGYLLGSERPERWKPVDVWRGGIKVAVTASLGEAGEFAGIDKSRVCTLLKTGAKTRTGYYFTYGTITDKGIK